jgi:hypothetical protein
MEDVGFANILPIELGGGFAVRLCLEHFQAKRIPVRVKKMR